MKFLRKMVIFGAGGSSYVGLELLWRGRSHISMFAAGGLCLLLVGPLGRKRQPLMLRLLEGMGIITAVELVTGLLVNRNYRVWDYREVPGNFLGQICLPFCLLWLPLAGVAMEMYGKLERLMSGENAKRVSF